MPNELKASTFTRTLLNSPSNDNANQSETKEVQATPRTISRFAHPVNTSATNSAETEQQGAHVNNQVNIDNFNVTNKTFDPNQSGYSNLNADFTVNGKVKEGDYFTVQYPEHVTVNGDVNYEKLGNLMKLKPLTNADGDVVATGVYDVNSKIVKYTFTNYVNDRNNIKGNFRLPIFTDRKITPNSGNYYSSFNVAGKDYSEPLNINYDSPVQGISDDNGPNISSFITDVDIHSGSNYFKQTIYVNLMQHDLYNSNVRIQGYQKDQSKSSAIIDGNTKFKIYKSQ